MGSLLPENCQPCMLKMKSHSHWSVRSPKKGNIRPCPKQETRDKPLLLFMVRVQVNLSNMGYMKRIHGCLQNQFSDYWEGQESGYWAVLIKIKEHYVIIKLLILVAGKL